MNDAQLKLWGEMYDAIHDGWLCYSYVHRPTKEHANEDLQLLAGRVSKFLEDLRAADRTEVGQ